MLGLKKKYVQAETKSLSSREHSNGLELLRLSNPAVLARLDHTLAAELFKAGNKFGSSFGNSCDNSGFGRGFGDSLANRLCNNGFGSSEGIDNRGRDR